MGSFLMNCFVSKQIIPEKAEVVIFPVVKNFGYHELTVSAPHDEKNKLKAHQEYSSFCYSNSFWEMTGLKIEAIADDCGRQTLVDNTTNRVSLILFFEQLKDAYVTVPQKKESLDAFCFSDLCEKQAPTITKLLYKEKHRLHLKKTLAKIPWTEFTKLWEKIQELVFARQVFYKNHQQKPAQLGFTICLKSAYDYLSHKYQKNPASKRFEATITEIAERKTELHNIRKKVTKNTKGGKAFDDGEAALFLLKFEVDGESVDHDYRSVEYDFIEEKNWKKTKLNAKTMQDFKKQLSFLFDFVAFQSGLNDLSIQILPMWGGHQDYQNDSGKAYAKMVNEIAKEMTAFLKKKYGND